MPTKRVVRRKPKAEPFDLDQEMEIYLRDRSVRERSAREEESRKKRLMEWLAEHGDEAELTEPIVFHSYSGGKIREKVISGIKRQTRVSQQFDEDAALELIKAKGLEADCVKMVPVVDEDALLAAAFNNEVTDAELAKVYTEKTTYAFNLIEGVEPES
jgi:hypothetical protein